MDQIESLAIFNAHMSNARLNAHSTHAGSASARAYACTANAGPTCTTGRAHISIWPGIHKQQTWQTSFERETLIHAEV